MRLKKGISLQGVQPSVAVAMAVVAAVYMRELGIELVITRCCEYDEKQSPDSIHGKGLAFDTRTWLHPTKGGQFSEEVKRDLAQAIRNELGPQWDVVVYDTHLHIEHDSMK